MLVIIDLETSGLDATQHDIVQIGAVALTPDMQQVAECFEVKVQFDVDGADIDALQVNSYDAEVWQNTAVTPEQALHNFCAFLRRHSYVEKTSKAGRPYKVAQVAGHNAHQFDWPFFWLWRARHGLDGIFVPADYFALDTLQMSLFLRLKMSAGKPVMKSQSLSLSEISERLGLDVNSDQSHDALYDANLNTDVFFKMYSHLVG
jgi:DNA polymerase III epsilon subunit-like protein